MKTRTRKTRTGKRKNARVSTERRLGTENLEGRILMAADMGGWPDASQASDEAEVKTDPATTQKKTAVKSKKQQITFYAKKQPTLSSRHAEGPVAELPNKIKLETAEHMKVHGEELADAQEIENLEGGFEEIAKLKGTSETNRILDDHDMFSNEVFGELGDKLAEHNGSLDSRLDSFGFSSDRSDASSAVAEARGRTRYGNVNSGSFIDHSGKEWTVSWTTMDNGDGTSWTDILVWDTDDGKNAKHFTHTNDGDLFTVTTDSSPSDPFEVKIESDGDETTVSVYTRDHSFDITCNDDGCSGWDYGPVTGAEFSPEDNSDRPAPDDADSGTPVTAAMAREAWAKFFAEHGGRPWNVNAGKPVPETDGDNAIDPVASRQLFDQLGRHKWNPRIVQPGPDGDNEREYLAVKESPSNLAFIKMELTGQPAPDDPDWGAFRGTQGGSSGGSVNPQPVTTQKPATADDAGGEEEVPQQED
jgi:hypothetical protein